jgi:hypothetical protein
MTLTREFVEVLIFGSLGSRRYTQDSPVLPDVWIRFGERPLDRAPLLITPHRDTTAGRLGTVLRNRLQEHGGRGDPEGTPPGVELANGEAEQGGRGRREDAEPADPHQISYTQGNVAGSLGFDELVRILLPLTAWWHQHVGREYERLRAAAVGEGEDADAFVARTIGEALSDVDETDALGPERPGRSVDRPAPVDGGDGAGLTVEFVWYVRLIGTLELALRFAEAGHAPAISGWPELRAAVARLREPPGEDLAGDGDEPLAVSIARAALDSLRRTPPPPSEEKSLAWLVSLNRPVSLALTRSVLAVKADAALRLFAVRCGHLAWAVLDSGVDASHPAFRLRDADGRPHARAFDRGPDGEWLNRTRIEATYDFTRVRRLLSPSVLESGDLPAPLRAVLDGGGDRAERLEEILGELRQRLLRGREVDWSLLEPLLTVPHDDEYDAHPAGDHGTHVAGIIGADWREPGSDVEGEKVVLQGICPDIRLYDFRVLGPDGQGDEFGIIAALQFIRHLNARRDYLVVHGINLSLSIPHDVANFACGRTPVCEECERATAAGVTVVAAAGNQGYLRYRTHRGYQEGYHTISITDPGNAEAVITVGATHRYRPHTYGVSYFSSRGPTGDGRSKPDLVAPGEKIRSCVADGALDRMDGTSMAAPHVSGAAAMLMARYAELVGQPDRIKKILCDSATDLGRQPYFQGAGMLDLLRALQSV